MKNIQVEIAPDAKAEIIEALQQSLAETAVATLKAQTFHWNVTGMSFGALHELFEKVYRDHFDAQDELAERVKALDGHADGRYSEFLKRSAIGEIGRQTLREGHGRSVEVGSGNAVRDAARSGRTGGTAWRCRHQRHGDRARPSPR